MRYRALKFFFCLAILTRTAPALAQSDNSVLVKHVPVLDVVMTAEMGTSDCSLMALNTHLSTVLARYGKSGPPGGRAAVMKCIQDQQSKVNDLLARAIRYLDGKPGAMKALKEYYVKWATHLDSYAPVAGEGVNEQRERSRGSAVALAEAKRTLILELRIEQ